MVEVFKTNVRHADQASLLIALITLHHKGYRANFDLNDCDRVLRIKCMEGPVAHVAIVDLLEEMGYLAELLPDTVPVGRTLQMPVDLPFPVFKRT